MLTLPQNKSALKKVALSSRLSALADCLGEGSFVCDVGSDHGALPLYLLSCGKCKRAIVTDLNEKPLERAKANLRSFGFDSKAIFVQTDGIEKVLSFLPDSFVIAGMGGETIIGILERALSAIPKGTVFVLQPMTKIAALRRFLYESGFALTCEKIVYENHKFFIVMKAVFDGVSRAENNSFSEYGVFLPKDRSETAKAYFLSELSSLKKVINGKKKAGLSCDNELIKMNYINGILEDINESRRD